MEPSSGREPELTKTHDSYTMPWDTILLTPLPETRSWL